MELNVKPVPIPDPVSAYYWENARNGKLTVQGFEGLDTRLHPPGPTPEIPGGGPAGAVPIALRQVPDAQVAVVANAHGPHCASLVLTT
jgi:hypothetical protein